MDESPGKKAVRANFAAPENILRATDNDVQTNKGIL